MASGTGRWSEDISQLGQSAASLVVSLQLGADFDGKTIRERLPKPPPPEVKLIDRIETASDLTQWLLSDFDYQYPVYPTNTDGFSRGMI